VLAAVLAVTNAKLFVADESQQKYMWESYKADFGKNYDTMEEEISRFGHFLTNLKTADMRNEQELLAVGQPVHGITSLSDLSAEEFALRFLRSDVNLKTGTGEVLTDLAPPRLDLGAVDWSGKYTTPVKNQGYCGSCWAFSATEQIETDAMRTLGVSYILSPEQITQCDTTSYGCSGGWTENAYNYVKKAGGIATEASYPYTSTSGTTGKCHFSTSSTPPVIAVSGYTTIKGEPNMGTFVQNTGPLSVCLDASNFNSYTGGVMSVCGKSVNHCVQAVGVEINNYWIVRNSWGTSWGESGKIRLKYGQNTCAITNDPTYVTVSKK